MQNRLERQIRIPLSTADNTNRIGIVGIFNTFMDLATEHGDMLGVGMDKLASKGLIWVAAKTRIKINERPKMLQPVTVATWPETPSKIRFNRYYTIAAEGRYLVEGKTEWAILDLNSGRPHKLDETYPVHMQHWDEVVCEGSFTRISTDFEGCDTLGSYTVCSADIDVSQHMNNAAYIRDVLGATVKTCYRHRYGNWCYKRRRLHRRNHPSGAQSVNNVRNFHNCENFACFYAYIPV